MLKTNYLFLLLVFFSGSVLAQEEDLLKLLEEEEEPVTTYTIATFKGTRVINGQSVENPAKGVLQFMIAHRFGRVNSGAYELFGLDNATIRLGFDYGITDRFAAGLGRSSFEKTYDAYLKYKLLRQKSGENTFPFTVTLFSGVAVRTMQWAQPERNDLFTSRLFYTHQVLIAQKVNENFSWQLSPTLVHRNLVETVQDQNDVFAIGAGGRYKLTGSISINAEYFYILPGQIHSPVYGEQVSNALSIGFDIETGGHVFQLHFSNSRGMTEKSFITETTGQWGRGDIHFGFNISRVFNIGKRR